ncbi:SSU ribosomal protein S15p (S13e) [Streptococcus constellatus]|nr:SSU ribosomal protein S15p (S13e) [Streptococcus constellatus]
MVAGHAKPVTRMKRKEKELIMAISKEKKMKSLHNMHVTKVTLVQ